MAIDRAATLRNADKLLRQGKLDQAIEEYLRVIEEKPRDWNTANLLGDLYLRAGQPEKAIEQFTRIADNLSRDGFVSKAGALFKKILKIKPHDEHALLMAAETSASQGLLADARAYLTAMYEQRRTCGDLAGAEAAMTRLAALDRPADGVRTITIESVEPIDRVEPIERVEPVELIEPIERVEPIESVEPIEPLNDVFAQFRDEASRRSSTQAAEQDLMRGMALYRSGQLDDALPCLEAASRAPQYRFEAASALGRIFLERGETWAAIEWLERAAQAPSSTPQDGHRLLYELADALEAVGEGARALAICLELRAQAGEYQDVAERVDRLSKVQARG